LTVGERQVRIMAADHGGQAPDLYQLLGVPREASREEIALAWRRRARAEHPDARPADGDAPGRFRALAEAWQVLGDPARRAAYDAALTRVRPAAPTRVTVRHLRGSAGGHPRAGAPEPPLRAGPVRVERPRPAPPADIWDEEAIRLAIVAELALRDLGRRW
jgi:DnaJ-domain-containing protein 1